MQVPINWGTEEAVKDLWRCWRQVNVGSPDHAYCGWPVSGMGELCLEHQADPLLWTDFCPHEMAELHERLYRGMQRSSTAVVMAKGWNAIIDLRAMMRELRDLFLWQSEDLVRKLDNLAEDCPLDRPGTDGLITRAK